MIRRLKEKLKNSDIPFEQEVNAKNLSTFRIGGTVSLLVRPRCEEELIEAALLCRETGLKYAVIGKGSNLLFGDGRIDTVLLQTTQMDAVRLTKTGVRAACGVSLARLFALSARAGFGGLEFACGIPGTLGGALAMNAGAHGKCIAQLVNGVRIFDFSDNDIKSDHNFKKNASYRDCGYQAGSVLFLSAELDLDAAQDPRILFEKARQLNAARRASQPLDLPSAGCAFKRPDPTLPIGKLLDELGCKGMRCGGAAVSEKHAAFLVNQGGANAKDVENLMLKIQEKVKKERGIILEREIRIIPSMP